MKKYILLTLIICFVVISYVAQKEEPKEGEVLECWDGQEHWFAPIYHMMEMTDPAFWQALQEAQEREAQQQAELNARDS